MSLSHTRLLSRKSPSRTTTPLLDDVCHAIAICKLTVATQAISTIATFPTHVLKLFVLESLDVLLDSFFGDAAEKIRY